MKRKVCAIELQKRSKVHCKHVDRCGFDRNDKVLIAFTMTTFVRWFPKGADRITRNTASKSTLWRLPHPHNAVRGTHTWVRGLCSCVGYSGTEPFLRFKLQYSIWTLRMLWKNDQTPECYNFVGIAEHGRALHIHSASTHRFRQRTEQQENKRIFIL